MIDIHEYMYLKKRGTTEIQLKCRYCNEGLLSVYHNSYLNLLTNLKEMESQTILHMMECKPFHEVKKAEIEEDSSGCEL